VLIEHGPARVLTDPVLRPRMAHLRRHGATPEPPERIDAVLVSHLHGDHLDLPSLKMLTGDPRVLVPRGGGRFLRRSGLEADELTEGESQGVAGVRVRAVRALHDARRRPWLGPVADPLGFVIGSSPSVYFAGDTDLYDEMAALAGRVDVALLPIWGWGPRLPAGHLNPESAARATALIKPAVVVPVHWGTLRSVGTRVCFAGLQIAVRLQAPTGSRFRWLMRPFRP